MNRAWILIFLTSFVFAAPFAHAESTPASQATIDSLQASIAAYQKQITALGAQKSTLQSAINVLVLQQKELTAQLQITQTKIGNATVKISGLTSSIGDKETTIAADDTAIGQALRATAENDDASIIAQVLGAQNISDAWTAVDQAQQFNRALGDNIVDLRAARTALSQNRDDVSKTKADLVTLQQNLTAQNKSIAANKATQQQLLTQTNNSETTYQKLLAQAQAELASFSAFAQNAGGSGILTNQTVCDDWGCYYNQRDSSWGNIPLSGTKDRLAADGCLITSLAMVLTHYGYDNVNPVTINSNPSNFSAVGGLLLFTAYVDGVTVTRTKETVSTKTIDAILATKNPVIVGLHAYGGTHFVVLTSGSGGAYLMRDPYIPNGKDISFSAHYAVSSIYEVNKVVINK